MTEIFTTAQKVTDKIMTNFFKIRQISSVELIGIFQPPLNLFTLFFVVLGLPGANNRLNYVFRIKIALKFYIKITKSAFISISPEGIGDRRASKSATCDYEDCILGVGNIANLHVCFIRRRNL